MSKSCNHTIGYLNDFVTQDEAISVLESEAHNWNGHNRTMAAFIPGDKSYEKTYKAIDFLDGRRGT